MLYPPPHIHTGKRKRIHLCTHKHTSTNTHTWSSCHTYIGMQRIEREYESKKPKQTHRVFYDPLFPSPTLPVSLPHCAFKGEQLLDMSPEESLMYNSLFNKCGWSVSKKSFNKLECNLPEQRHWQWHFRNLGGQKSMFPLEASEAQPL